MARREVHVGLAGTLVLAALWLGVGAGMSGSQAARPGERVAAAASKSLQPVPWTELTFKARKLLLSATTTLKVSDVASDQAHELRREVPQGTPLVVPQPRVTVVTSDTDLPFGRNELTTAWIDPERGIALQSEKLVTGSKQYWKLRRYTREGFFRWRAEPRKEAERRGPWTGWSKRDDRLFHWQAPPAERVEVTDSYTLLYLLSAARLDRAGSRFTCTLFTKTTLVEAEFVAGEIRPTRLDLVEVRGGKRTERRETVDARVVHGRGTHTGTDAEDVDLGLLGMHGEVEVLLEIGSGLPVVVEGRAKGIGRLTVRLRRAVLRDGPQNSM